MKAPCYGCPERTVGCHENCDRYKEFKAKKDAVRQKEKHETAANVWRIEAEIRMLKHKHLHGRGRK